MVSPPDQTLSFPILSTPARQQTGAVHLTGGNCGECSAIHTYLNQHRHVDATALPAETRVVTVKRQRNADALQVPPPCNPSGPAWGCRLLTAEMRIHAVDLPYVYAELEQMTPGWTFVTEQSDF